MENFPTMDRSVKAILGSRSTLTQYFHGTLDDIRLYNRALTEKEVLWLYNEPKPAAEKCTASGTILREYWANLRGGETSNVPVNRVPTSINYLTSFEAPSNVAENYASRIRGYLCAPETGHYTFWIASDDYGDLYLSADDNPANKQRIAYIKGSARPRQWNKYPSQKSALIYLEKGKRYYIEALHKEALVMDNLAVGWRLPSSPALSAPEVISGSVLSPAVPENLSKDSSEVTSIGVASSLRTHPNPFTDQLTIQFTLQENGPATLELYDTHGLKVNTLFKGTVESDKVQQVALNSSKLTPGIYIIRLINGQHQHHRRVMLFR
jgi:hypothetical protein